MKHVFVVDENVYIFFHTQRNERGLEDLSSLTVVESAIANCHSIALSVELYRRYSMKHDAIRERGQVITPRSLLALLKDALAKPPKGTLVEDAPPVIHEDAFHDDDVPVVRVAAAQRAILLTTDDRLIRALNDSGIAQAYGIRALRPEAALSLAASLAP